MAPLFVPLCSLGRVERGGWRKLVAKPSKFGRRSEQGFDELVLLAGEPSAAWVFPLRVPLMRD